MTNRILPPELPYAPTTGRYYATVWDTRDIPVIQDVGDGSVLITPTFENLVIYGREVGSVYAEDQLPLRELKAAGRINGEWFSVACPEGELGTHAGDACQEISEQAFSDAYQRGWNGEPKGESSGELPD